MILGIYSIMVVMDLLYIYGCKILMSEKCSVSAVIAVSGVCLSVCLSDTFVYRI